MNRWLELSGRFYKQHIIGKNNIEFVIEYFKFHLPRYRVKVGRLPNNALRHQTKRHCLFTLSSGTKAIITDGALILTPTYRKALNNMLEKRRIKLQNQAII